MNQMPMLIISYTHLFQLYKAALQWCGANSHNPNYKYVMEACEAAEKLLYRDGPTAA